MACRYSTLLGTVLFAVFACVTGQVCDTPSPSLDTSSNGIEGVLTVSCTVGSTNSIIWRSMVFVSNPTTINLLGSPPAVFPIPLVPSITGVNTTESRVGDSSCLMSTITFTGDVAMLNGTSITCLNGNDGTEASGTIRVASTPEPVVVMAGPSDGSPLSSCTAQWSEPFNGGDNITAYYITVTEGDTINVLKSLSYTEMELSCPGSYTYNVVAENRVGNSSSSNTATCEINVGDKMKPNITQVCVTQENSSYVVNLTWIAVGSSNPLTPVQDFTVSYNDNTTMRSRDDRNAMFMVVPNQNYSLSVEANISVCDITTVSSGVTILNEALVQNASSSGSCYTVTNGVIITPSPPGSGGSGSDTSNTATVIVSVTPQPSPSATPSTTPTVVPIEPDNIALYAGVGGGFGGVLLVVFLIIVLVLLAWKLKWFCFSKGKEPVPLVETGTKTTSANTELETGQVTYQEPDNIEHTQAATYAEVSNTRGSRKVQPQAQQELATYQDPSTIQHQPAPTGELYTEVGAKTKKQPAVEMATYQDPATIQHTAATTGDLYAQPEKKSARTPKGAQAPQSNYAAIEHDPVVSSRPPPPATDQVMYSEVNTANTRM